MRTKRTLGVLISSLFPLGPTALSYNSPHLLPYRCKHSAAMLPLKFDNRSFRELPVDNSDNNHPRQVSNAIFCTVTPTPVNNPKLVAASKSALTLLGFDEVPDYNVLADYFSGNCKIPGSETAAHCYCGYQFGSFAGQLGDGAAISLGEVINAKSDNRWEIQLKGAGVTPYSRSADGRKVLRSTIREFLASEAMHFLHVPTTRAATCVSSDSTVARDPYYDGRVIQEKCAIVSRIAPNFFRFGSFEIFKTKPANAKGDYDERAGPSAGNVALEKQLLDHLLKYYPDLDMKESTTKYDDFFGEVVRRTAVLIARWQCVGFVHGVMNTDNMSLMGLTIDYGPYGFMEYFDPDFVPNGSDSTARYSYSQQPSIGKWNLQKLYESLKPFLNTKRSEASLADYDKYFAEEYYSIMRSKLGFLIALPEDEQLINELFHVMKETMTDFTDMFVAFTELQHRLSTTNETAAEERNLLLEHLLARTATPSSIVQLMEKKQRIHRLSMHPSQIQQLYDVLQETKDPQVLSSIFGSAPVELIREEIASEKKKLDMLLHTVEMKKRYEHMNNSVKRDADAALWSGWLDKYLLRLEKDAEVISLEMMEDFQASLSGEEQDIAAKEQWKMGPFLARKRKGNMEKVNPTFILRNWILQEAINEAEKDNFHSTRVLLSMIETPFRHDFVSFHHIEKECGKAQAMKKKSCEEEVVVSEDEKQFLAVAPAGADSLYCTCSS